MKNNKVTEDILKELKKLKNKKKAERGGFEEKIFLN